MAVSKSVGRMSAAKEGVEGVSIKRDGSASVWVGAHEHEHFTVIDVDIPVETPRGMAWGSNWMVGVGEESAASLDPPVLDFIH